MPAKMTHAQFQKNLDAKFGRGAVVLTSYSGNGVPVEILLPEWGEKIVRAPRDVLRLRSAAAARPNSRQRALTHSLLDYQKALDKKFGTGEIVALEYVNAMTPVRHRVGGAELVRHPDRLLRGVSNISTLLGGPHPNLKKGETFVREVESRTRGNFDLLDDYRGWNKPHRFKCRRCHLVFKISAAVAIRRVLCYRCDYSATASSASSEWLKQVGKRYGIRIRTHRSSGGEKTIRIEGKRYSFDGYSEKHRIVFEYHGRVWHGSNRKNAATTYSHPFSKKLSDLELYRKTKDRERRLRRAGYTVISVWDDLLDKPGGLEKFFKRTDPLMERLLKRR